MKTHLASNKQTKKRVKFNFLCTCINVCFKLHYKLRRLNMMHMMMMMMMMMMMNSELTKLIMRVIASTLNNNNNNNGERSCLIKIN